MQIHPDKTAERAVDACGGTYTAEQKASGYADGHFEAVDAAMMAVRPVDALMADMLEALKAAEHALTQFTAFELDCREIMGNTNFAIVQHNREAVRSVISKATTA